MAAPLSLEQIRQAYEMYDTEPIEETFKNYVADLIVQVPKKKAAGKYSLATLVPVDFLKNAEPSIKKAMNFQGLELDKLHVAEEEEQRLQVTPLQSSLLNAVIITHGKIPKKRKKRRSKDGKKKKRKRKGGSEDEPPRKKKKKKKKSDVGDAP